MSEPLLYRVGDAAQLLAVSRATLYRLIASGDIKTVQIGGLRRIDGETLRAFIAAHTDICEPSPGDLEAAKTTSLRTRRRSATAPYPIKQRRA